MPSYKDSLVVSQQARGGKGGRFAIMVMRDVLIPAVTLGGECANA